VEVADEAAGSNIHETKHVHTMRPSLVPMDWPTKRPLLPTPVAATERPIMVRRPAMPTLGKPTFPVPIKTGAPPPVHEIVQHQPNFNKEGRKRPSLRPRDKIRCVRHSPGIDAILLAKLRLQSKISEFYTGLFYVLSKRFKLVQVALSIKSTYFEKYIVSPFLSHSGHFNNKQETEILSIKHPMTLIKTI